VLALSISPTPPPGTPIALGTVATNCYGRSQCRGWANSKR
jgi:hypothetical protein